MYTYKWTNFNYLNSLSRLHQLKVIHMTFPPIWISSFGDSVHSVYLSPTRAPGFKLMLHQKLTYNQPTCLVFLVNNTSPHFIVRTLSLCHGNIKSVYLPKTIIFRTDIIIACWKLYQRTTNQMSIVAVPAHGGKHPCSYVATFTKDMDVFTVQEHLMETFGQTYEI